MLIALFVAITYHASNVVLKVQLQSEREHVSRSSSKQIIQCLITCQCWAHMIIEGTTSQSLHVIKSSTAQAAKGAPAWLHRRWSGRSSIACRNLCLDSASLIVSPSRYSVGWLTLWLKLTVWRGQRRSSGKRLNANCAVLADQIIHEVCISFLRVRVGKVTKRSRCRVPTVDKPILATRVTVRRGRWHRRSDSRQWSKRLRR